MPLRCDDTNVNDSRCEEGSKLNPRPVRKMKKRTTFVRVCVQTFRDGPFFFCVLLFFIFGNFRRYANFFFFRDIVSASENDPFNFLSLYRKFVIFENHRFLYYILYFDICNCNQLNDLRAIYSIISLYKNCNIRKLSLVIFQHDFNQFRTNFHLPFRAYHTNWMHNEFIINTINPKHFSQLRTLTLTSKLYKSFIYIFKRTRV